MALHGPVTFVGCESRNPGAHVPGFHHSVFQLANGLPPGATVLWECDLSVTGIGTCGITVKATIVSGHGEEAEAEKVMDDDVWEDWGMDGNVAPSSEPEIVSLTFDQYVVPLSSFLVPRPLSAQQAGFKEFAALWSRSVSVPLSLWR